MLGKIGRHALNMHRFSQTFNNPMGVQEYVVAHENFL